MLKLYIASLIAFAACMLPSDVSRPTELGFVDAEAVKPVKALKIAQYEAYEAKAVVPVTPMQFIQVEASKYGWGSGSQWTSLQALLHGESGVNPYAVNKSSGACGLFQALPCSKLGVPLSDVGGQAAWGLKYISERYGSPGAALSFWNSQSPHWY